MRTTFLLLWTAAVVSASPLFAQKKTMTFSDVMQFRAIETPILSKDGAWVALTAQPDRGDGEVIVRSVNDRQRFVIPLGSDPIFSDNANWLLAKVGHSLEARSSADDDKTLPTGAALLNTSTGNLEAVENIKSFSFSANGKWMALLQNPDHEEEKEEAVRTYGTNLEIRHLETGERFFIQGVRTYAFDQAGDYLTYAVAQRDSSQDGLFIRPLDLASFESSIVALDTRKASHYSHPVWSKANNALAFLASTENEEGKPGPAELYLWQGDDARAITMDDALENDWYVPATNELSWSEDGTRLFLGLRPPAVQQPASPNDGPFDPYDYASLLEDREVDVWHWNDPLINSNQKQRWKAEQERTYAAVYHLDSRSVVQLGTRLLREVERSENTDRVLARAYGPYNKERTWDGTYFDLYVVDQATGGASKVGERLQHTASLSPGGQYVVYYQDPHWHLVDLKEGATTNLTASIDTPFANEDNDYPQAAPGYGIAGWLENDTQVIIYDKYDIWLFPTDGSAPNRLTAGVGRQENRTFRIVKTDPDQRVFKAGERLLLRSYHNERKNYGFYEARTGRKGVHPLLEEDKRFRFVAKAENADVVLFTRESYNEFPDLWVSDGDFTNPRKLTDVNPQMSDFAWGTSELIEWSSTDGIPLQGVVIKPDNFDPNKRYPLLVYFYRFFSQRLHEFNQPRVNHRPAFPLYASNDYVIFLPDVRFEIGRPGFSATKCIIPGVQKLVDLGIVDPNALGLHGHSWSGYQTAFMITQTDLFAAAVAGAPVSNMTSAYSGIRWQTGLARQFQYERSQSRLGGSLWEARDHYIDNSPVFFADQIETPLLIMHGDDDGAVPWYQSIELYLAMRRLEKEAIFLQYRGEPHHLQKYPNKLDYAIKMKEYFDHYLKGLPAADWIEKGIPYRGD